MNNKDNKTLIQSIESHIDKFFEMHGNESPDSGLYNRIINEVERVLIKKTINHSGNIHTKAAKILGINRNTLRKKIKELEIE